MDELIYNQKEIPKDQWRYGLRSSASTGCGWIATHNALHLLGYRENIEELIRYYQRQFPLVNGNFGTTFWGPAQCFRHWGFQTDLIKNTKKYDRAAKAAPVCILFYWWKSGFRMGAHFVALQYRNGSFYGYNTYSNSTGPDYYGPSLEGFIRKHGYFGTVLTVIHGKAASEQ